MCQEVFVAGLKTVPTTKHNMTRPSEYVTHDWLSCTVRYGKGFDSILAIDR
jgi:hypothetical protein